MRPSHRLQSAAEITSRSGEVFRYLYEVVWGVYFNRVAQGLDAAYRAAAFEDAQHLEALRLFERLLVGIELMVMIIIIHLH